MYYLIFATDVENSLPLRMKTRPAHLARLEILQAENRLLTAGPFPLSDATAESSGFSGSCIIADFPDLQQATEWAQQDPYHLAGVYANIIVKPYKKVFPC